MAKSKTENNQSAATADNNQGAISKDPQDTGVQLSEEQKKEFQDMLDELELKKKELKAKIKGTPPPKAKKEAKGILVSFKNQAGTEITGLGSLYYVTRSGGKLHYKAADAVHVLDETEIAAYNEAQKAKAPVVE